MDVGDVRQAERMKRVFREVTGNELLSYPLEKQSSPGKIEVDDNNTFPARCQIPEEFRLEFKKNAATNQQSLASQCAHRGKCLFVEECDKITPPKSEGHPKKPAPRY